MAKRTKKLSPSLEAWLTMEIIQTLREYDYHVVREDTFADGTFACGIMGPADFVRGTGATRHAALMDAFKAAGLAKLTKL